MDVKQQSGVAIMFGARFESIFVPLVFELEYKVAELFGGVEAVGAGSGAKADAGSDSKADAGSDSK